jgi:hypothetical protein
MSSSVDSSVVLLKAQADWPRWLAVIQTKANHNSVWNHIKPTLEPNEVRQELLEPSPPVVKTFSTTPDADPEPTIQSLTADQLKRYEMAYKVYKDDLKKWERKQTTINDIDDYIMRTTGTYWSVIERVQGVRERLEKLKDHVAPSTYAREQEVLARYDTVRRSAKATKTEEWLKQWESVLSDLKERKLPEAEGIRPTRAFLLAIENIQPLFAQTWFNTIESKAVMTPAANLVQEIPDGFQIAKIFRNQVNLGSNTKGAFSAATLQGEEAPTDGQKRQRCVDGYGKHTPEQCHYLNKDLRPEGWKMSLGRAKLVIKGLKKNKELRDRYKDAYKEIESFLKEKEQKKDGKQQEEKTSEQPKEVIGSASVGTASFATQDGSFSASNYPLVNSFILDCGSPIHICNDFSRFDQNTFQKPDRVDPVLTGDSCSYVEGYGEVQVNVNTPAGRQLFQLKNVAYIPGFHTNVISHRKLRQAGYRWDDLNLRIQRANTSETAFSVEEIHDQYVVEHNSATAAFPVSSTAPRPPREADAYRWHLRMGHLGKEALERLMSNVYGVKIKGPVVFNCEACIQGKAKKNISRRQPARIAPRPLWRIHFDLFHLEKAFNQMRYALVIKDEFTGHIWAYPVAGKTQDEFVQTLKDFSRMIKAQYDLHICRIRRDNERSLGKQWDDWIRRKGIKEEPGPPHTKQPVGSGERAGGVIRPRALSMQLAANLPGDLWPETWQAAAYIHNRSPREQNSWKTPRETLLKWLRANNKDVADLMDQPDTTNIYTYGCRAYPIRNEVLADQDRTANKTRPRTHIGYLVGYQGSNIYRIWVPQNGQIVTVRDVEFNEDEIFDPNEEPMREHRLRVYRKDPGGAEPLPDTHQPQDSETDSEIGSIIVVGDGNGHGGDGIDEIDSETDSDCEDEPGDYPTPQSLDEQTNMGQNDNVSSESSSSRAETPSSTSSEPSQQRTRAGRATVLTDQAQRNLQRTGNIYGINRRGRGSNQTARGSNFAIQPVFTSFYAGSTHRLHRRDLPLAPRGWKDMQKHPHKREFMQACEKEWGTLTNMKILEIIERSQATMKPLPLTWVFTYKFDKHGFLQKFKSRICVRGDLQPFSEKETYAATLAGKSFRMLMALAARWDLQIRQLDAVNAFPNSELDEEVYVELPDGYKLPGKVGRLLRALYGLRRSPLLWQKLLSGALQELGLQAGQEEPCIFLNDHLIVFFFVDDICYMFRDSDQAIADKFRDNLTSRFKMRDLEDLKWFLGIRVVRDRSKRRLWLCQDSYIEAVAARFNLICDGIAPATPMGMQQLVPNEDIADHATTHLYQRKIGSILYPAVISRPDIAFTAARLSSFLTNPSPDHMAAANRCIQYLYGSRHLAILFDGLNDTEEKAFKAYTDASFADDLQDRKSTQGYLFTLFGGPIAWKSGKQPTVTTSSTEAELLALSTAAKEAIAAVRLFRDVRLQLNEDLTIWCDNKQTIRLVKEDMMRIQTALRHVDIHNCWVRQEAKKGSFEVKYLPTTEMPADGLTKALDRGKFDRFVAQIGLTPLPEIETA